LKLFYLIFVFFYINNKNKIKNLKFRTNNNNSDCSNDNDINATNAKSLVTLNEAFQAIRSCLHFSQLSSWMNQARESSSHSKNIVFSVTYSNEHENENEKKKQTNNEFEDENEHLTLNTNNKIRSESISISQTDNNNSHHRFYQNEANSQIINTSDFDFQSFPTLNLLFCNNSLYNQQKHQHQRNNNSNTNLTATSIKLITTTIKIDLYSRKRKFIISGSLDPSNSLLINPNKTFNGFPHIPCSIKHNKNIMKSFNDRNCQPFYSPTDLIIDDEVTVDEHAEANTKYFKTISPLNGQNTFSEMPQTPITPTTPNTSTNINYLSRWSSVLTTPPSAESISSYQCLKNNDTTPKLSMSMSMSINLKTTSPTPSSQCQQDVAFTQVDGSNEKISSRRPSIELSKNICNNK
jgi:hypothetical protein